MALLLGSPRARSSAARPLRILCALLLAAGLWPPGARARGGWPDPPRGWTYVYEAVPGEAAYVPGDNVVGLLDGTWAQHLSSSQWDGSAPGEIDTDTVGPDGRLSGASPGGTWIRVLPGLGEGGGEAAVLSIEDSGDPTTRGVGGRLWSDPSNRKLYFWHKVKPSAGRGWTLIARVRLTPDPVDVDVGGAGYRGLDVQPQGKGQLSVVDKDVGNFSVSLGADGRLQIAAPERAIDIGDPTRFHTLWIAARRVDGARAFRVKVFVDGAGAAAFDGTVPAGSGTEGGAPRRYLAMGLHRTVAAAAMEVDYFGYRDGPFEPGVATPCPEEFECERERRPGGDRVSLEWENEGRYEGIDIDRDGEALARDLPGDIRRFVDEEPLAGTHVYDLAVRGSGGACAVSSCEISICPENLRFEITYPQGDPVVILTWDVPPGLVSMTVLRDGEPLAGGLPGDTDAFTDENPPPLYTVVRYEVVGYGPGGRPCAQVDYADVLVLPPEGPWQAPPGGWDYIYDAEGHDPVARPLDRYVPAFSVPGNLDGSWIRSADSDRWDGSAPGESGPPPEGPAPGGVRIDGLEGEGPCGEAIACLRIEDAGDPGGYGEIDNRKIFLGRDTGVKDRNLLADGATLCVRWRLTPDPADLSDPGPDGSFPYKEHGQVGLFFRNTGDPALVDAGASANLGFSLRKDNLYFSGGEKVTDGLRAGDFVALWATVRAAGEPDRYRIEIYLDGGTRPVFSDRRSLPAGEEPSLGDEVVNALGMGFNHSADDGSMQLDWIAFKAGIVPPRAGSCVPAFRRGDVEADGRIGIGDAIVCLNYLFAHAPAPGCIDAADADDDGRITIGDAIAILNYLFVHGPPPAPPGPDVCGADETEDDLGPCVDPACR